MSVILKIKIDDVVDFPIRSKILTVDERDSTLYAWVVCDGDPELTAAREFLIIGTGREFNRNGWDYQTTIHDARGTWHIFTRWQEAQL